MTLNLTELKKRFRPEAALAITLESERLAVSLVTPENGVKEIKALPMSADAIASNPEKAGKELASALEAAGIRQRRCVVCVPPDWALTASADMPDMAAEDLRSFLELRAEREFPMSATDMSVAHSPYTLPDGKRRTTLAAIPAKRMEAIEKMLATAGCRAVSISLALDECLTQKGAALHFLANGTHTNVIITAGGGVVSMRSLASPGPDGTAPFNANSFLREIRITLGRVPEGVRQQLRQARFAGTPASAERLRDATGEQLRGLGIENLEVADTKSAQGAAAVKAARAFLAKEPVAFEFVVPEVNRWEAMLHKYNWRGRNKTLLIAAGVILLPALVLFIRGRYESYYKNRWAGMSAKYAELDALQKKIRGFRPWFDPSPLSLQTISTLVNVFPETGEVWAKSIHIDEKGYITCTGFTRSQPALTAMLEKLRAQPGISEIGMKQSRGDNPIQFSFTFKSENLHEN